jgi:hypothetical protein
MRSTNAFVSEAGIGEVASTARQTPLAHLAYIANAQRRSRYTCAVLLAHLRTMPERAGALTLDLDQMVNRNKAQFCAFESAARGAGRGRYPVT